MPFDPSVRCQSFQELTIFTDHEIHGLDYFSVSSSGEHSVGTCRPRVGSSENARVFESSTPTGRLRYSYRPVTGCPSASEEH